MNEKRITSRDVYYLIRRPTRYQETDYDNDNMTHTLICRQPEVKRQFNSDHEPHFSISTAFMTEYLDGVNCELFRRHDKWVLTDSGNCAFAFGAHAVDSTSSPTDLQRFNKYIQKLSTNFNLKYNHHHQTYYLAFNDLRSLQKAFYSVINFEISYASVMGFIA